MPRAAAPAAAAPPSSTAFLPPSASVSVRYLHRRISLPVRRRPPHPHSAAGPRCLCVSRKVTTLPLEHPLTPDVDILGEILRLQSLRSRLLAAGSSLRRRLRVLDREPRVRGFLKDWRGSRVLEGLGESEVYLVKSLVAAGQGHVLGLFEGEEGELGEWSALKSALHSLAGMVEQWGNEGMLNGGGEERQLLKGLLKVLADVEQFYDCVGGIIGYQIAVLELLASSAIENQSLTPYTERTTTYQFTELHVPPVLDLSKNTQYASQAALWGIEGLPNLGEIYPIGGSGDRLGLVNHDTGECLPAAMLLFCGRTLLESLIRDLQAREFLYFKIYNKQCITPVAIMTSSTKNNHSHIRTLCEELRWFGRGQENFQLFEQPLVPVVGAEDGQWLTSKAFSPICKPGGHGAIWKLAHDRGIYKWFYKHGRKGATVRQISNVAAATDVTLLALAGIGLRHGKKLGFASCQQSLSATEGVNVLMERKSPHGKWECGITCVEYTEFEKLGLGCSLSSQRLSNFPANTNILYVDLPSAEKVGSCKSTRCLPGMVLNLRKPVHYADDFGFDHCVYGGRLECTMQNIADNFTNSFPSRSCESLEDVLDTFIVYNERKRVTSSAKKKRKPNDKSLHQTPDGALLDILRNAYDILSGSNVKIPKIEENCKYLHSGPPFLVLLHPALGPVWEVIRQKFCGGSILEGSELQLEVAEFLWEDVQLDGSLLILAESIMGSSKNCKEGNSLFHYGHRCGRCKLQNVKVRNRGIDWNSTENVYWKHDVRRLEVLKIVLHGNAEFEARNVTLEGNLKFEVPSGYRMLLTEDLSGTGYSWEMQPVESEVMDTGSWYWRYKIAGTNIKLEMVETSVSSLNQHALSSSSM